MRMKTVEQCSSISLQWQCSYTQEPINDWIIAPQNPLFNWSKGNAYPRDLVRQIQVPELQYVYPGYDSFKFKIYTTDSAPSQWLSIQNDKLVGDELLLQPGESTNFLYKFINLELLPAGEYVNQINIIAFGIKNGVATELTAENIYSSGVIKLTVSGTGSGGGGTNPPIDSKVRPHKSQYQLSVIISNAGPWDVVATFGDTEIKVLGNDNNENIYIEDVNTASGRYPLIVNPRNVGANGNIGELVYRYSNYPSGFHKLFFNILNDNAQVLYTFPVLLTLTDETSFEVSPEFITQSIDKSNTSATELKAVLSNPNNFNISVLSKPEFVQAVNITGNNISILVKPGNNLSLGNHAGDIVFTSGNVTRKISLTITVINFVLSDFIGELYYFALDKRKIIITRSNSLATKVYMKLEIFFSGYGQQYQDTQEFQLSYFKGSAEFDPGKEIQDFFIRNRELVGINDFVSFGLAQVNINFTERNDSNEILNTYSLPKLYFAPGKKPKCFPLFTDHPVRRTFPDSKITLSTDILSNKNEISELLDLYNEEKPAGNYSAAVKTYFFFRNKFKPDLIRNIISGDKIQYLPVPAPQKTAHIFWENQNLVMDWFSASVYNTENMEFENIISTNYKDGHNEKYDSIKTKSIQLQTGWFLKEERELIDDLMASRFCIIEVDSKIYKALPNGKKNPKPSDDTTHSVILEFELLIE